MNSFKKICGVILSVALSFSVLTGCTAQDKTAVTETSTNFLAAVASDSTEDINKYATSDVVSGEFVKLFDADSLVDIFVSNSTSSAQLSDESKAMIDDFCARFADMIKSYSISNVKINKDNTATAIATVKTSFAVDIINSADTSEKINEAIEAYNTNNADEISALYEEGKEVAEAKIYNDMIKTVLEIYEEEIDNSKEMTYAIAITLEKNPETDTWIVTNVTDYDSSN
ncbi:hypothetical protein [Butyrivibrio sp. YAB3001]|uniref:hypothetical protein n=1 Tax=Butyrivibrio sp. YAB3001 TaxID=1520812 RepID=UPI0008F681F5|nr:hypothetical protein [Butyrivibrio sp. YAB3001]SFB74015.1 hypothetical protein SAMN02910398_00541 [Butyrivibrio sp. YAB3001]